MGETDGQDMAIEQPPALNISVVVPFFNAKRHIEICIQALSRPMSGRERLLVYRKTIKRQRYSWARSTMLMGVLVLRLLYWIAGGLSVLLLSRRAPAV